MNISFIETTPVPHESTSGVDVLHLAELVAIAAAIADAGSAGTLTAAEFRDRLANGRKVAIQILEFFDRAGVTVRVGDERRVRADRLALFGVAKSPCVTWTSTRC